MFACWKGRRERRAFMCVEPCGLPWIPRAAEIKVIGLTRSGADTDSDVVTAQLRSFSFPTTGQRTSDKIAGLCEHVA